MPTESCNILNFFVYHFSKTVKESGQKEFGNTVYTIKFEQIENTWKFGHRYRFILLDAIDDCVEFVINMQVLTQLAKEYGLELVDWIEFHDLFNQEAVELGNTDLLHRMNVLDEKGSISPEEWEAIGLYVAFSFKKASNIRDYLKPT